MNTQEKVLQIMALAMEMNEAEIAFVFVRYSPHCNLIDVDVFTRDSSWDNEEDQRTMLFSQLAFIYQECANKELDEILCGLEEIKTQKQAA